MQNYTKYDLKPEEFERMNSEEKILKMASGLVPPAGKPQKEVLEALLKNMEMERPVRTLRLKRYLQAAAAIFILLFAVKIVPSMLSAQQVKTVYAENAEVVLPDGTEVVLNAASKLKWDKKEFAKKRYLTLKGEAYFNVKKGNKFIIETKNGRVEILGTQLNVFSRNDEFWVSCISGKVRVSTKNREQIITPGEWVKLDDSNLIKSKSETIENTILWKEGIFHFEDTKLEAIFDELERQFDVSIQFKGDPNRKATIDFSNKDLNEALDIVCIPMELSYDIKQGKISVSEK